MKQKRCIEETPDECGYQLSMFGSDGGSLQDVPMDRAEYVTLKRILAVLRDHPKAGLDPEPGH